jgi:hypothetical protein
LISINLSNNTDYPYASKFELTQYSTNALGTLIMIGPTANATSTIDFFSRVPHGSNSTALWTKSLSNIAPESMNGNTNCRTATKRSGNHKAISIANDHVDILQQAA